eukprot:6209363-Pyramimonas_sp.AAC.1
MPATRKANTLSGKTRSLSGRRAPPGGSPRAEPTLPRRGGASLPGWTPPAPKAAQSASPPG